MNKPLPAYEGSEPYVFVCYAHEDKAIVYKEIRWLQDRGVKIAVLALCPLPHIGCGYDETRGRSFAVEGLGHGLCAHADSQFTGSGSYHSTFEHGGMVKLSGNLVSSLPHASLS